MRTSMRSLLPAFALLAGCGAALPPPPVAPRESPRPILPPPPWQTKLSAAEGYEAAPGQAPPPVVIRGATLMLATGQTIPRGTIILDRGKIAVVAEADLPAPPGAVIIDGTGKFVTPGIIDTHSHIGVYPMLGAAGHTDGNEATEPVTPSSQTVDAFWPQDPGIERAVAGGVTAIQVLPGSANLIGGRAVTLKLRPATSPREMHVPGAADGLKMACGENPKRVYGESKRTPMTRMGNLALQRAAFLKARKLQEQWARWRDQESRRIEGDSKKRAAYEAKREERAQREAWCRDNGDPEPCSDWRKKWSDATVEEPQASEPIATPDRDPGIETLVAALEGRVLVHVHCYRADDMMAMIALSDEVGFRIRSFHHALEAYKIREHLAARQISVSTWADWWGFKMEAFDGIPENAALVHESGGRAVIHSDSEEGIQRLNQEASKALASGRRAGVTITEEDAIRWVTINPAWALGVDHRMGSLEPGKDADVVLWNRSPLSVYALAERVWIDGAQVYERGKGHWSDFELGQSLASPPPPPVPSLLPSTFAPLSQPARLKISPGEIQ
jgi:imidazolonepropionase-like amidohydrolase